MMDYNLPLYWKVIHWRGKSTVLYPTNEETPRSAGSILYPNYRIADSGSEFIIKPRILFGDLYADHLIAVIKSQYFC
jgi:hypothetical protein